MKKLIIVGLLAAFALGCTAPEISDNAFETHGTKKSEAVSSEGDSRDLDLEEELDDTEY